MSNLGIISKAILDHHANGFFSLDQIAELTKFSRKRVTDVLVILSQEGLVKKIKKQRKEHIPGHSPRFSLTYRIADRKALAARIAPRLKEETTQDRMWFIIRKKRYFVLRDLIILAGVKMGMARWFLKGLRRMGIIRPSRTGGGPGVEWMLVNDVGPKRPYIEPREKAGEGKMEKKAASKVSTAKRRFDIKVRMSLVDVTMLKRRAKELNTSASEHIRMLINCDYRARRPSRELKAKYGLP